MRHSGSCIPSEEGVYFATFKNPRGTPYRVIIQVGKDGFGHVRAFVPRWSRGADLNEFENYSPRIVDPEEK